MNLIYLIVFEYYLRHSIDDSNWWSEKLPFLHTTDSFEFIEDEIYG